MRKFITLLVLVGMVVFGRSSDVWAQTSDNPLDDGGWTFVAHISNQGGMFDGIGSLDPNYEYGTRVKFEDLLPGTPDFQRPFPFDAVNILFITGNREVWAIADFDDLRTLITAFGNDQTPNLALEVRISGIISNVTGNVLSRGGFNIVADPWISMNGSHGDGVTGEQIIWGENDYGGSTGHAVLKNSLGGMDVFISGVPEENVHNIASHSDSTGVTGAELTTLTSGAQISDALHSHTGGDSGGGGPGNFYAEDYVMGSETGGIQEAFTACNDADGGVVFAPQGLTEIDATSKDSPIINIPVYTPTTRPITVCEFRGYGMNTKANQTSISWLSGGSTIHITNADLMNAGPEGYKVVVRANAGSYDISHMSIVVSDSDSATRAIFSASAAVENGNAIGENGINNWRINNVAINGSGAGTGCGGPCNGGVGIEWWFSLKGVFRDSEVKNWDTAAIVYDAVPTQSSTLNDANFFSGVKLRNSSIGFLIKNGGMNHLNMVGMVIEGNTIGLKIEENDGGIHEYGGYYEQTGGALEDRVNVLITDLAQAANYQSIATHYGGTVPDGMDIYRTTGSTGQGHGKDMVIGASFNSGVTYEDHSIMIMNSSGFGAGTANFYGDVSGVFSSYATNCTGEGARERVGVPGDGCWQRDTKTLYVCHPLDDVGNSDGVCDDASEWIIAIPVGLKRVTSAGGFTSNISANTGGEHISDDVLNSIITSVCQPAKACHIGAADQWPSSLSAEMSDWISEGSFDDYDTAVAAASYSSILGADDTILNAQLSTSIGCRHCKICALETSSGHLSVGPGGHNFICGESEYSNIVGGAANSILGPTGSGVKSANNTIGGGVGNIIDMQGYTTGGVGGNMIAGGANNLIDTNTTAGVLNGAILAGENNKIINNNTSQMGFGGSVIVGGINNEIELRAEGANRLGPMVVMGRQGYAHIAGQIVFGAGPGYGPGDSGVGTMQVFSLLLRSDPTGTSFVTMNSTYGGAFPDLAFAGIYTITGKLLCHDQTDITSAAPTKMEMWDISVAMTWTGGVASPRYHSAAGTGGTQLAISTDWTVGGTNTWEAKWFSLSDGFFTISISPGVGDDDLFCESWITVTQTRGDTTP